MSATEINNDSLSSEFLFFFDIFISFKEFKDDIEKVSGLNSDTLQEAVQNNDTTKEIMKDMDNIAKNSAANIGYTHCMTHA